MKHGEEKQTFETGAQRDTQAGKTRPDLISPVFLDRLGIVLAKGGEHYGERNWEKGMPLSRILASAMRHLIQTIDGLEDEDHPAQCAWNMMAYIHTLHRIRAGSLPTELDDLPREKNLQTEWSVDHLCNCADYQHCLICAGRFRHLEQALAGKREKNLESGLTSDKKSPRLNCDKCGYPSRVHAGLCECCYHNKR